MGNRKVAVRVCRKSRCGDVTRYLIRALERSVDSFGCCRMIYSLSFSLLQKGAMILGVESHISR